MSARSSVLLTTQTRELLSFVGSVTLMFGSDGYYHSFGGLDDCIGILLMLVYGRDWWGDE